MTKTIETPGIVVPPEIVDDLTRREFLVAAGLITLVPACGNDGESDEGTSTNSRVVEHKFGETKVSGMPERVVALGTSDHDCVLAFGVAPVAVADWNGDGDFPNATGPWAQEELGDAEPEMLPLSQVNFEKVAALEPDLIISVQSGMTDEEYETVSEIAPTVAAPKGYVNYGVPWQEQARVIARALGREERGEELIADVEGRFEAAREAHPEFVGASAAFALFTVDGTYDITGPEDTRARFLDSLGFEIPERIVDLVGEESFYATFSHERFDLVGDLDVLVWSNREGEREHIEDEPLYTRLDVAKEGRDVFITDDAAYWAFASSSILSLPFALEKIVPMLAAAVDGNPGTEVEEAS